MRERQAPFMPQATGTYHVQPRRPEIGSASRACTVAGVTGAPISAATMGAATASSTIKAEAGLPGRPRIGLPPSRQRASVCRA